MYRLRHLHQGNKTWQTITLSFKDWCSKYNQIHYLLVDAWLSCIFITEMSIRSVVNRQPAQQLGEGNHTQILRQFLQIAPVHRLYSSKPFSPRTWVLTHFVMRRKLWWFICGKQMELKDKIILGQFSCNFLKHFSDILQLYKAYNTCVCVCVGCLSPGLVRCSGWWGPTVLESPQLWRSWQENRNPTWASMMWVFSSLTREWGSHVSVELTCSAQVCALMR